MQEALIAVGFMVVAVVIGALLKPDEDQRKPLTPQVSGGGDEHAGRH